MSLNITYRRVVLKKKNRQHENLQKYTIAIHLIAISPTRRCFPFLFMFSFSFPAILPLHVFFFCECSFFSYDIVVSFDCLSRRGNASATCMRKILLSYCGSVSLPSILLQSTDQRGLGGLVDFRQAKGEREHEQRGEQ